MRLLWVKAGRLLPADSGGKLRSYHLALELSRRHELTMLTYYDGPRDLLYEQRMEAAFPGAVTLRYGPTLLGKSVTTARYVAKLLSPAPFAVTKFTARNVRGTISRSIASGRFDAYICDFLSATLNFESPESVPSILFQHNVESVLWERQARHAVSVPERIVFAIEAAKMRRYEPATVRRYSQIVAVSESDRELMAQMTDPSRITVVPTGVDASRFGAEANREPAGPVVLFLGTMDYQANIDGVEWMCATMWPQIRERVPNAVFRIVGRNPHGRIQRLQGNGVEVVGAVQSVDPYLAEAAAFVVPLRMGGGTRIKIFEAMSAGRAVVSTSVGAEGLPVAHGSNILLADEPAAFVDAVVSVLTDASLRRRIGGAGHALALAHDWSAVVGTFEEVIERAAGSTAVVGARSR